jgi:hypothetical protein
MVKRPSQFSLLIYLLLGCPWLLHAQFTAHTDRDVFIEEESFQLILTLKNQQDSAAPDLSPLQQNFQIGSTQSNQQMHMINGQVSRQKQWTITLIPKRSGPLTIPALQTGGFSTQAMSITVTSLANTPVAPQANDAFIESELSSNSVYVQAELLLTLRIYIHPELEDLSLNEPKIDNVFMEQVGKDQLSRRQRQGKRWQVIERKYAIFPQTSGQIIIPPLVFQAKKRIQKPAQQRFDPFGRSFGSLFQQEHYQSIRARSQQMTVEIKPQPDHYRGKHWLPARNLQLIESWTPEPVHFQVGQALTRTIELRAEGLLAEQLPLLESTLPHSIKQYPDKPVRQSQGDTLGVISSIVQKIALMPNQSGTVTLPAITLHWWNTVTDRAETLQLPEKTVQIHPADQPEIIPPVNIPATTPAPPPTTEPLPLPDSPLQLVEKNALFITVWWPWLLSLLLVIGWWFHVRQIRRQQQQKQWIQTPQPIIEFQQMAQLRQACKDNQATLSATLLLQWATTPWPNNPPLTLITLASKIDHLPLHQAILQLDKILYTDSKLWDGNEFWQAFEKYSPTSQQSPSKEGNSLLPLYP